MKYFCCNCARPGFTMLRSFILLALISILYCSNAGAQQRGIGRWRAHLPFNNAQAIATDGINNYVITNKGFLVFPTNGKPAETFSKVEGMHEAEPVALAYDIATSTAIIGYNNSNIDLYRHNNFTVLPDLKNKSFAGSKSINNIYADHGFAYLSTGLGIVVIDLERQEVKETYVFSKGGQTMAINAVTGDSTYFYAASSGGLYRIARNAPSPQVFATWQPIDTGIIYSRLAVSNGTLFAATSGSITDSLYRIAIGPGGAGSRQRIWFSDSTIILHLDGGDRMLYAGTFSKTGTGRIYHFSVPGNAIVDSSYVARPNGVVTADDGRLWVADGYQGIGLKRQRGPHQLLCT